jgi:hypothetical protein
MTDPMNFPRLVLVVSFLVLWVAARLGSRLGNRMKYDRDDFSVIQSATLTLLGLIVGFTLSMAVSRYDQRKLYEEEEANAIGTEYVRVEVLPASEVENAKKLLREYLDQRVQYYQLRDGERLQQVNATTDRLQSQLWASVRSSAAAQPTPITALAVSGMNDVLNSQGYTQASWWNRIPTEVWALLIIISVCGNFMIGLYLRHVRTNGLLLTVFPTIVAVAFFLIADIDSPRGGLIRVSPVNLIALSQSLPSEATPQAKRPGQ